MSGIVHPQECQKTRRSTFGYPRRSWPGMYPKRTNAIHKRLRLRRPNAVTSIGYYARTYCYRDPVRPTTRSHPGESECPRTIDTPNRPLWKPGVYFSPTHGRRDGGTEKNGKKETKTHNVTIFSGIDA